MLNNIFELTYNNSPSGNYVGKVELYDHYPTLSSKYYLITAFHQTKGNVIKLSPEQIWKFVNSLGVLARSLL